MKILGSHNSWSYLPPRKWWMWPIRFMARCQQVDIKRQYELGVRCFDLRVRFNDLGLGIVSHGVVEYCFTASRIYMDLSWLNEQGDCQVRVLHEARNADQYNENTRILFRAFCSRIQSNYKSIRFWCGRNLYNWSEKDYDFGDDPECEERYASVTPPKLLAWWPWLFSRRYNHSIREQGTEKDILLIDFVDLT